MVYRIGFPIHNSDDASRLKQANGRVAILEFLESVDVDTPEGKKKMPVAVFRFDGISFESILKEDPEPEPAPVEEIVAEPEPEVVPTQM